MASKNTSKSSCSGTSGGGDEGDDNTSKLKNQKQERVPQRRKSIAELERILREEAIEENAGGHTFLNYPQVFANAYSKDGSASSGPALRSFSNSSSSMYGKDPKFSSEYPFPTNGSRQTRFSQSPEFMMLGKKQPWTSLDPPPFDHQASAFFAQCQTPHQPPYLHTHNAYNLQPRQTFFRDTMMNMTNSGGLVDGFNIFDSSTTSQLPQETFIDDLLKSNQAQGERVWSAGNSFDHKAKTQPRGEDITLSLGIRSDEVQVEDTGLDLDLKL